MTEFEQNNAPAPEQNDQQDVNQNRAMGILAYIGPLVFVPMFAAKNSPFARFHANQGLILFILEVAAYVVFAIAAILAKIPVLGLILAVLLYLAGVAVLVVSGVFAIIGLVAAARGLKKELPIIGKIKILK